VYCIYNCYVIDAIYCHRENDIARNLNISYQKYIEFLTRHRVYRCNNYRHFCHYEYYFEYQKDAETAIEKLESYLVMEKLCE